MKRIRNRYLACIAGALACVGPSSHALPVSQASPTATFDWSYDTGSSVLTGSGSMTIVGWNSNQLELTVSLSNTAQIPGQGVARLTAFAFGIDADATSVGFLDAGDGGMVASGFASGVLSSQVAGVDVCVFGSNSCSGGGTGGIHAGSSDEFRVLLGGTWGNSVDIAPIGLRYHTDSGAFTFAGDSTGGRGHRGDSGGPQISGGSGGTATTFSTNAVDGRIPEPATTALVGLSLGLLGLRSARRRKTGA